jgi:BirA family biotin operon repressor/biotin-[acetyl-CoA-carboxylase] ligase
MASPTIIHAIVTERAAALTKRLAERGHDLDVSWVVRTESTSDDAKKAASSGTSKPAVWIAEQQTAGRGRSGNRWVSDPGAGLLLSVLLFPKVEPGAAPHLTLAVGASLAAVVDTTLAKLGDSRRTKVKWPNDLELDEKKLAGILVEAQTRGDRLASLVVGVGLNIVPSYFDEDVAKRSAALTTTAHVGELDRAALAFDVVDAVVTATRAFAADGLAPFLPSLRERDALLGQRVRVGSIEGTGAGLGDDGRLVIQTERERVAITAGTVERLA